VSSIGWSKPARVEIVYQSREESHLEDVSVYMEVEEIVDLPMPRDQSYAYEGTPAGSVLVSEGHITSWLKAVPGDLARLTPSPSTLASPREVTSLSEMQPGADQSPPPTYMLNHQSPPPGQSPQTRQLPERSIQLEAPRHGAGTIHEDVQVIKEAPTHHSKPRASWKRTAKRGSRLPARPFEPDVAVLSARLLVEGATTESVRHLRRVFPALVSAEALVAPLSNGSTMKKWHLLIKRTKDDKWSASYTYSCRLCPPGNQRSYKDSRNILRHLRKDHFGLAFVCEHWWVAILFHG